jgi:hypothetical protein
MHRHALFAGVVCRLVALGNVPFSFYSVGLEHTINIDSFFHDEKEPND